MKKNILGLTLATTLILACVPAFANEMPFEPIFETAPISESITTTANAEPVKTTKVTPVSAEPKAEVVTPSVEDKNLQNALLQLDSAQVEIRNQLLQHKTEYTNIDNQYKLIKEQRSQKAKLIRDTERKIKNLDKTKEKIRKNMNEVM